MRQHTTGIPTLAAQPTHRGHTPNEATASATQQAAKPTKPHPVPRSAKW